MHEAYAKNPEGADDLAASMAAAADYNDGLRPHLGRCADDLHPLRARALLAAVPDDALVGGWGWGVGGWGWGVGN